MGHFSPENEPNYTLMIRNSKSVSDRDTVSKGGPRKSRSDPLPDPVKYRDRPGIWSRARLNRSLKHLLPADPSLRTLVTSDTRRQASTKLVFLNECPVKHTSLSAAALSAVCSSLVSAGGDPRSTFSTYREALQRQFDQSAQTGTTRETARLRVCIDFSTSHLAAGGCSVGYKRLFHCFHRDSDHHDCHESDLLA